MKFAFIATEKAAFQVRLLCRILGVSRAGFYACPQRPPSPRAQADARLGLEIAAVHARSCQRYGSPRIHADLAARGCHTGRTRVARLMRARGLAARRRRRGDCWDNAVAESFFATLKVELVHEAAWKTRAAARAGIFAYIEGFYNGQRRHSALDYLSPRAFEQERAQAALAT